MNYLNPFNSKMQDKVLLILFAGIAITAILLVAYYIDTGKEPYYRVKDAYSNPDPFKLSRPHSRRRWQEEYKEDYKKHHHEEKKHHEKYHDKDTHGSYLRLKDTHNSELLVLPDLGSMYDTKRTPVSRNISPSQSGMKLAKSAFTIGGNPLALREMYGVGYTDERGIC
jgi:hypothetical protein